MEKSRPNNCPTCLEKFNDTDKPLQCGHWIHVSCIQKGHKAACHLCRAPLDIKVYGKLDTNPNIEQMFDRFEQLELEEEQISSTSDDKRFVSEDEEFDREFLQRANKIRYPDSATRRAIYYAELRIRTGDFHIYDTENEDDYDENSVEWDYPDEA